MAEAIVSPIAELIIGTLDSAAVEEIKSLWNVEDELDDLEDIIKTVKAILIDAEKRQIREEQVRVWLERLEDAVYLADDLVDEISTEGLQRQLMMAEDGNVAKKVRTFFSGSNQLLFRREMAGKIKDVRSKLDKIAADRERFHFVENMREEDTNAATRSAWRETRSFVLREDVIGRDGDKDAILKLLLETSTHEEKVSVIPIVGMGGLGKTTLAQLVFNDESVKQHFDKKIWVCVSDMFDERLIIEKMVKIAFNMSTKDLELEQLQNILLEKLVGKRYLLVLDDVWNENPQKWKNLEGLLMSFAEGSRIIVTTRSKKVAEIMRTCIQQYDLGILDPENSWSLFKKLAFGKEQEQINSTIKEVGKEIVKKCKGIPLVITMIGSLLCHKNSETEWQLFLQKELSNISQEENYILPTLKLSYDCLTSHLKHCFTYCRLFPKDYEIDVETLVTLWMAQGFIKSSNPSQSLEEIGYGCFMELFWRSFFQEDVRDEFGKVKKCKMHDLVHDLAIQVAGGEYAMLNVGEGSIHKRIRHVSFEFRLSSLDEVPSSLLQAKRLRSILLPNQMSYDIKREQGESICDLIVSNFKFLRMLDLHNLGIRILPNSIGKLKHLRYLDLSYNGEMEVLPTCIIELVNLQTLKLNGCWRLNELPRDINKLVNLRHLEFYRCDLISRMPRGLGQLTNLQTLSQFVLSDEDPNLESRGSELDELAGLNNLSEKLKIRGLRRGLNTTRANLKEKKILRSLSLHWYGGRENDSSDLDDPLSSDQKHELMTIEGLHPHPNLRELTLWSYGGVKFSSWLPLLTNLVNLQLFDCRKCRQLPPLIQFPSLKKMILESMPCLEYITNDDNVGGTNFWTSLRELQMRYLPNLKGWSRLPDHVAENQVLLLSFPCLSKLEISYCANLTCMPLYPNMEDLRLWKTSWKPFEKTALMSEITTFKAEDQASSSSAFSTAVVSSSPLSKLKILTLGHCSDVDIPESLPNWMKSLTSLKTLHIGFNPKLKYLSPAIHYLTTLQELKIWNCEELIEISNGVDSIMWEALLNLRALTFKDQRNLVALPEGLQRATTLKTLDIMGCDNLTTIPDWISNLCSLKYLHLSDCPNLIIACINK